MRKQFILAAACSVALGVAFCDMAPAAQVTRPATTQSEGEQLLATVSAVTGNVQVRDNETKPWRPARVGEKVPVGGECRTGPRSSIVLTMPPEQVITLDRLGVVKILDAFRNAKMLRTDLGMQYGRLNYKIEAGGLEHESTIRSPSSALAVRGTNVTKQDDALGYNVTLNKGLVLNNVNGHIITLGTGEEDEYGNHPPKLDDDNDTPAEFAFTESSTPYSISQGLTPTEKDVAGSYTNVGGMNTGLTSLKQPQRGFGIGEIPDDGPVIVDDTFAPGRLSFNLSWAGDRASGPINPDLDLFVISPKGDKLVAVDGKPFTSGSGGVITPNDRGGKGASLGVETATWPLAYPVGRYIYGVNYNGEGDPATFKIIVLRDGQQINADFSDTLTEDDRIVTFGINVLAPSTPETPPAAKNVKKSPRNANPVAARNNTPNTARPAVVKPNPIQNKPTRVASRIK